MKIIFNKWKAIEVILAVLFLVAPFYYHPNIGGEGLRIPNNITAWIMATVIIAYSLHLVLKRPTFVIPKYFIYIAAFPIIITVSGFVTGVEQPLIWLFRLLFIWGGLAFFFSLFQHGLKQGRLDRLLLVIVLSALLQGLVGVAQIWLKADMPFWLPKSPNGIPSGLFQQINNMATYQVTAIMIAGYLISRPLLTHGKLWMQLTTVITVAMAGFLVTVSGSRIGALTLILGLLIIIPAVWQRFKVNKKIVMLTAMALLIGVGFGATQGNSDAIDKTIAMQSGYSGSTRLGIYNISFNLIGEQPLFGYGIGSFGRVFQYARPDFYVEHPDAVLNEQYVSHPHNEILFWLVEGGVIAGIGLLIVLIGILLVLKRLGWKRGGAYAAMLLPIGLHTQVELPLHVSASFWFLLLFLLVVIFNNNGVRDVNLVLSQSARLLSVVFSTFTVFILIIFLMHSIKANRDFVDYRNPDKIVKQDYLKSALINPYYKQIATWINMNVILYSSIDSNERQVVEAYTYWGESYLRNEPTLGMFQNLGVAYNFLNDRNNFCTIVNHGAMIYPNSLDLITMDDKCRSQQ